MNIDFSADRNFYFINHLDFGINIDFGMHLLRTNWYTMVFQNRGFVLFLWRELWPRLMRVAAVLFSSVDPFTSLIGVEKGHWFFLRGQILFVLQLDTLFFLFFSALCKIVFVVQCTGQVCREESAVDFQNMNGHLGYLFYVINSSVIVKL